MPICQPSNLTRTPPSSRNRPASSAANQNQMTLNLSTFDGSMQALQYKPTSILPDPVRKALSNMGPDMNIIFELTLVQRGIINEADQDDLKKHLTAFSWVNKDDAMITTAAGAICDEVIGTACALSVLGNIYQ